MKFFDLEAANNELRAELEDSYRRVLSSGWMILGPEVEQFESEYASYCETLYCVGVSNGLDALKLILQARGIGAGDEVIVPAHTFIATWLAVEAVGATIVPVDVCSKTFTLDIEAVRAAITPRTAVVIPVSLYGHPVDMDPLMKLAERHGLFILEDAAQSHGARYRGRRVGSFAHATAFSFYPTKNLGALGDAGGIVTNDAQLADKLRRLRNYGSSKKYLHSEIGTNARLDEMQASFLRARLPRLDEWNSRRRALASAYGQHLGSVRDTIIPDVKQWAEHVYHLFVVRVPHRSSVITSLEARNISTLIHYPIACHMQSAFAHLGYVQGAFPIAELIAQEVLSLPMWPQMPEDAPMHVAEAIIDAMMAHQ